MMKKNSVILIVAISAIISMATSALVIRLVDKEPSTIVREVQPVKFANYSLPSNVSLPADFTYAAGITTPGVVHVTSKVMPKQTNNQYYNPFRDLFGDDFWGWGNPPKNYQPQPNIGSQKRI